MARLIVPVGMQGVRVVVVLAVAAVLTVATVLAPGCVGKDSATEDVEWAAEDDLQGSDRRALQ